MNALRLKTRRVAKPWGRRDLLPCFGDVAADAEPIGEIWFEDPRGGDAALMIKYLFTSEKLSIQVHPDDAAARASGHKRGKDEAWVVLATESDAQIGVGLRAPADKEEIRAAALNGRIEAMVDWRPAQAGDFYYAPAGTIHSLGPGLTLIEIQQNIDLTYRLYDFGRPRELHLDHALAAATPMPYRNPFTPFPAENGRLVLAEGKFVLERWLGKRAGRLRPDDAPVWLVPVDGVMQIDGQAMEAGSAWLVEGDAAFDAGADSDCLIAYCADRYRPDLLGT